MILKNGAIIWSPAEARYSHHHLLTREEMWHVLAAFTLNDLTPFVFALQPGQKHALFHGPLRSRSEHKLADLFEAERHLPLAPLSEMPDEINVINVFSLGGSQPSNVSTPASPMRTTSLPTPVSPSTNAR